MYIVRSSPSQACRMCVNWAGACSACVRALGAAAAAQLQVVLPYAPDIPYASAVAWHVGPGTHMLRSSPLCCGVCRQESVAAAQQVVAASVQSAGLQLLVNNAGICTVAPVEFFDLQSFRCGDSAAGDHRLHLL
jgi:NAD(P)-dependent dehydrogenase (short-subunit alcohol dehydrogenase family)